MIVVLDESLAVALEQSNGGHADTLAALQICAQQVREGTHVLWSARSVFNRILSFTSLDARTRAALTRSRDKTVQRKALVHYSNRTLRLVSDDVEAAPRRSITHTGYEIILPVSRVSSCGSLVSRPLLMTENLNDGRLYVKLVQDLVASGQFDELSWLKEVPLRFELAPGGGQTLAQLFAWHIERGERIGVAIADGDFRFPGANVGTTAASLKAAELGPPPAVLQDAYVLPVRSLENLIPRATLCRTALDIDKAEGEKSFRLTELFDGSALWHYYPVKAGVKCFEVDQPTPESGFLTAISGSRRCPDVAPCIRKADCRTFLLPAISGQLVARAAADPRAMQITQPCLVHMAALWKQLVQLLFSFFCGAEQALNI